MIFTDLHLHSCLSPCGDDASTPFDLVGMAKLNGLELIALTDHNSAANCPAAARAAAEYELGFIPGLEVNCAEDVHMIALFPTVGKALTFGTLIHEHMPPILNKPEIFGNQLIYSPEGDICGREELLLISACDLSVLELPALVAEYGGLCYPAHIDRDANGLLAALGTWPPELNVNAAEIRAEIPAGTPEHLHIITASDAHTLWDMPAEGKPLPLSAPTYEALAAWINSKRGESDV